MASSNPAAKIVASTALAAASLFYADRKLGVSRDVAIAREESEFMSRFPKFVASLGPQSPHLYRLLELADPRADALWFEGKTWSYRAMKDQVDALALGLVELGVKDGDLVAVFMSNCPEMVFTMYALTKLGAAPALLNNALRDSTLLHCVRLANASLILSTPDLAHLAAESAKSLSGSVRTVSLNVGTFPLSTSISHPDVLPFPQPSDSTARSPIVTPPKSLASVAALIYTSGTTGKPKACSIKNFMICVTAATNTSDHVNPKKYLRPLRTYSCMPLFHGTTFFTAVCYSAGNSGCFCLGRKFSARGFWKECHESRATRILYVGELCRFLLMTAEGKYDRDHSVIVAKGNGLQKDVWIAFQKRFGVPEIREFYRSTEGLVKFDNRNLVGKSGAGKVGYMGILSRRLLEKDQFIVKFDYDNELPLRDPKTGFCVPAQRGEAGEAIAKIKDFSTYTDYMGNEAATEQKILRDVFEKGDAFQRSGDLLMIENNNWVKFVDRIGDTYRWNGENVAAGEVRAYISELKGAEDVVVVGKRLEKYDGQAGTAMIVLGGGVDMNKFASSLYKEIRAKGVPKYAAPRLILIRRDAVDVGDTFKHAKAAVKNIVWGTNVQKGSAQYYLDIEKEEYAPLDQTSWDRISQGLAKL